MSKNKTRKNTGWAWTKRVPHKRHPANYKKTGQDEVEYITFTHSSEVELDNKKVKTIPLTNNVSEKERAFNKQKGLKKGENISYAYPKIFKGKRSALGEESKEHSFVDEDKKIVNKLFDTLKRENINKTSNSNNKSKANKTKNTKNKHKK